MSNASSGNWFVRFNPILQRVKHKLGIDQAIAFGSLSAFWSLAAGPVTLLLIASHFSQELQGYYYTFNSLLALTIFVELGLGMVIQQFASHEWSKLNLDNHGWIIGDPDARSRLASLGRVAFQWYGVASILAATGIGFAGIIFFSQSPTHGIEWTTPWLVLSILAGVKLTLVPTWSLLDGCNQMRHTNAARFWVASVSNLCAWVVILLGGGLWTAIIASGAGIVVTIIFLLYRYRNFFKSIFSLGLSVHAHISWRYEVWPMQWKIALSWVSGYFIFSLFTPIMFQSQGAVVAGQMGMTLSLANALLAVSSTWINTRAPTYGMLIARQDYVALDRLFVASTKQAMVISGSGALVVWVGILGVNLLHHPLAIRVLSPLPAGLFLLSIFINIFIGSMATYLRAHKQEPYLIPSIFVGISVALSTVILGSRYGADGAAIGYIILTLLFLIPEIAIFIHYRSVWHGDRQARL